MYSYSGFEGGCLGKSNTAAFCQFGSLHHSFYSGVCVYYDLAQTVPLGFILTS